MVQTPVASVCCDLGQDVLFRSTRLKNEYRTEYPREGGMFNATSILEKIELKSQRNFS